MGDARYAPKGQINPAQGRATPPGGATPWVEWPHSPYRALQSSPHPAPAGWGEDCRARRIFFWHPQPQGVALGWVDLPFQGVCLIHPNARQRTFVPPRVSPWAIVRRPYRALRVPSIRAVSPVDDSPGRNPGAVDDRGVTPGRRTIGMNANAPPAARPPLVCSPRAYADRPTFSP